MRRRRNRRKVIIINHHHPHHHQEEEDLFIIIFSLISSLSSPLPCSLAFVDARSTKCSVALRAVIMRVTMMMIDDDDPPPVSSPPQLSPLHPLLPLLLLIYSLACEKIVRLSPFSRSMPGKRTTAQCTCGHLLLMTGALGHFAGEKTCQLATAVF